MGFFSNMFGSGANDAAQQQLTNYWNQSKGFLSPYSTAGNDMLPMLIKGASSLMNPEQLQSQWASSYQESPEAKQLAATTQQSGMTDASAMGLGGSSSALSAITQGTGNVVAADQQNFLHDLMQKYITGLNVARGIYSTGAGAAGQLGTEAQNMGQSSADLAYNAASGPGDMIMGLIGTLGGAYLGGPAGAALGKKFASSL